MAARQSWATAGRTGVESVGVSCSVGTVGAAGLSPVPHPGKDAWEQPELLLSAQLKAASPCLVPDHRRVHTESRGDHGAGPDCCLQGHPPGQDPDPDQPRHGGARGEQRRSPGTEPRQGRAG